MDYNAASEFSCAACNKRLNQAECKTGNVCSDCLIANQDCNITIQSVIEENQALKVEIELLRRENRRMRARLEDIKTVAETHLTQNGDIH